MGLEAIESGDLPVGASRAASYGAVTECYALACSSWGWVTVAEWELVGIGFGGCTGSSDSSSPPQGLQYGIGRSCCVVELTV